MLTALKKHVNQSPKRIMCDFETAAINEFGQAFPDAEIRGCYFHFIQALWRNIQEKGVSKLYISNDRVRFHLKLYKSIGFVPLKSIDSAVTIIEESLNHLVSTENLPKVDSQKMADYHKYFKETWINNPTYPRTLWNHHNMTTDCTNNNNEGFNNLLQHFVGTAHPSLYRLINDLKAIETRVNSSYLNIKNGFSEATKRKPIYLARDTKISSLKSRLESSQISLKRFMVETSGLYTFDKKVDSKIIAETVIKPCFFDNFFSIFKLNDIHKKKICQIRNYFF